MYAQRKIKRKKKTPRDKLKKKKKSLMTHINLQNKILKHSKKSNDMKVTNKINN